MTRKHFIKLASLIKNSSSLSQSYSGGIRHIILRDEFMSELCKFLKEQNQNFDERKFRKATGEILGE